MIGMLPLSVVILALLHLIHGSWLSGIMRSINKNEGNIDKFKHSIHMLTRQVMMEQFVNEERVRSDGQSGIKTVRQRRTGRNNYDTESHSGYAAASIHEHANNVRTIGLGEFTAVLNGIEFRTRHNDYHLNKPHTRSRQYHATENIEFPDVPPEVLKKKTVKEQIIEMREWFKAWQHENHKEREYRKYFKPVLCYLEGGWTYSDDKVDEPFHSERHFINAKTWQELNDKVRYAGYSGSKSLNENLSYLPAKIMGVNAEGVPIYAQWNYRILCHPLRKYISTRKLRLVDDLSSRMMTGYNIYKHLQSRAARFQVAGGRESSYIGPDLLDELMGEIPGKDNYKAKLLDEGLDTEALDNDLKKKNVARYHRWYKVKGTDAFGMSDIHRGYNDNYLFAARTTQSKIAGINITKCASRNDCYQLEQKWTYAIPLEIIYLTPLSKWNPHGIVYHGEHVKGNPATKDGRYGDCVKSKRKQLNGTTAERFYHIPRDFFEDDAEGSSTADSARTSACVLDKQGNSHEMKASGTYVMLPHIKDIGILRQRYPIFPVHGEGTSVWKELNALREVFMNPIKWEDMISDKDDIYKERSIRRDKKLLLNVSSRSNRIKLHEHYVEVSPAEVFSCKAGKEIIKTSSVSAKHTHKLRIRWDKLKQQFYYYRCDGEYRCGDGHPKIFSLIN